MQLSLAATEEMFLVATGNYVYEKDAQRKITESGEKINSKAKRALTKRRIPFLPAHVPAHVPALEPPWKIQGSLEAFLDPLRVSRALIYRACA